MSGFGGELTEMDHHELLPVVTRILFAEFE
jgi:hypothetical protein